MRNWHATLMIAVALTSCPARAQDAYPANTLPSQAALNGSAGAGQQALIQSLPPINATALPPANPTLYGPVYGPAVTGQQYQVLPSNGNPTAPPPDIVMPALGNRLIESTWYTRVDYFHWNESSDGMDFVNEYGTLITLGYMRRGNRTFSRRIVWRNNAI